MIYFAGGLPEHPALCLTLVVSKTTHRVGLTKSVDVRKWMSICMETKLEIWRKYTEKGGGNLQDHQETRLLGRNVTTPYCSGKSGKLDST